MKRSYRYDFNATFTDDDDVILVSDTERKIFFDSTGKYIKGKDTYIYTAEFYKIEYTINKGTGEVSTRQLV